MGLTTPTPPQLLAVTERLLPLSQLPCLFGYDCSVQKNGAIACKDKRCTLGAILFKHYEPARKIQEEFNALIERAEKVAQGNINLNFAIGEDVFDDYVPSDDKFPDPSEVSQALDMDDDLTNLVVQANDTSRKILEEAVQDAKTDVQERRNLYRSGETLAGDETYQEAVRTLKARIILEEELLGKGK